MINLIKEEALSSNEQIVNFVVQRYNLSEHARKPWEPKWDKAYQYYRAYRKFDADYWWRSQLFMPFTFSIIESICPWLIEALVGGENYFTVMDPNNPQASDPSNMTMLMRYQNEEKVELFLRVVNWIRNTLIYGTGIVKIGWWKKERNYRRRKFLRQPYFGIILGEEVKREKRIVYNDPVIDTVPLENIFPDPYGEDIKSCRYIIERKVVDYEYLVALKEQQEGDGGYKNIDQLKETKFTGTLPHFEKQSLVELGGGAPTSTDKRRRLVELLEYWEDDELITIANRKVCIRPPGKDNPYYHGSKPYAMLKDYGLDKEFFAMGEAELLAPLNDKINDLDNLRIDNIFQALNRMYIVQRKKGFKADEFVSRPYGLIWSDDIGAVKPLIQQPVPAEAFTEREITRQDMERVSGAYEYAQGATPQRKETATGIVKLQEAALKRFGLKIKIFQKTGFKEALEQEMQLNQQFLPEQYQFFYKDQLRTMNPWDIEGKFLMTMTGSSDLIGEKERFAFLYDRAANDPYYDQYKLRERLLAMLRIPGAEELLKKIEGVGQLTQAMGRAGMEPKETAEKLPEMLRV